jgi:hypothetical protein
MKNDKNLEYIAVKVEGINHWFWFETKKVTREDGTFEGMSGWGKGGNLTDLSVPEHLIEGEIYSQAPQYSN